MVCVCVYVHSPLSKEQVLPKVIWEEGVAVPIRYGYQSTRHTVMSSLCQLLTSQLVSHVFFTESTRHNAVIHDGQRDTILGDFRV